MDRIENDLLGDLNVPINAYYGVQTQRAIENFHISGVKLNQFPEFIKGLAYVKWAAAETNFALGLLDEKLKKAIVQAAKEVIDGQFNDEFPIDMIQGGAGTSTNMNINEVLANRALEILGYQKGEYQYCSPNDHVNLSQSTNDAYPTSIKLAAINSNIQLIEHLKTLIRSFRRKGGEIKHVLKMGRTQLKMRFP